MLASLDADLSRVLDLYAGTGALGIEALSREKGEAVFVERDRRLCDVIQSNLREMGQAERGHVLQMNVQGALQTLEGPFTLVLADPPYEQEGAVAHILNVLVTSPAMAEGGLLAVEYAARTEPGAADAAGWVPLRKKTYGDTGISIYRKERREA
jgi:16S rRNA (guanine966-N2)-methyltransferase